MAVCLFSRAVILLDRNIRRRPRKEPGFLGRNPPNFSMFMRQGLAPADGADKWNQFDGDPGIGMEAAGHFRLYQDFYVEFLDNLPQERSFRGFSGIYLATRELPESGVRLRRATQCSEEPVALFNDGAYDTDRLTRYQTSLPGREWGTARFRSPCREACYAAALPAPPRRAPGTGA